MIAYLSAAMGLEASDPLFWMPLALSAFVFLLGASVTLMDGFGLGVGMLLPLLPPAQRSLVLERLAPWQENNHAWLLLLLIFLMVVFPFAWALLANGLYLGLLLLVTGGLLKIVSDKFARALSRQVAWFWIYGVASALVAIGYGVLLGGYVTGLTWQFDLLAFYLIVIIAVLMSFLLLGCTWLVAWTGDDLLIRAARVGAFSARWSAAGMVAVALTLGLTNPAVFYKWTHADYFFTAATWWLVMLGAFVWLDMVLRHLIHHDTPKATRIPFALAVVLLILMLSGLAYSAFPFVIIDKLSLWDAVASPAVLQVALVCAAIATPFLLVSHIHRVGQFFAGRPLTESTESTESNRSGLPDHEVSVR